MRRAALQSLCLWCDQPKCDCPPTVSGEHLRYTPAASRKPQPRSECRECGDDFGVVDGLCARCGQADDGDEADFDYRAFVGFDS